MKKIFYSLMLFIAVLFSATAQKTIVNRLEIKSVATDTTATDVLVRGADRIVKKVPISFLKGEASGTPDLDQVLTEGNNSSKDIYVNGLYIGNGGSFSNGSLLLGNGSGFYNGQITLGNGNYLSSWSASNSNLDWPQTSTTRTLTVSVNGNFADNNGNIVLDSGPIKREDQGSGYGIFRTDRDPQFFRPIGNDAVDLSNAYGIPNTYGAFGFRSTIGGGWQNINGNGSGVIAGGSNNSMVSGHDSFIGGGYANNTGTSDYAIIVGGDYNTANSRATVLGGSNNRAEGTGSVVLGGFQNTSIGEDSIVLSGNNNAAYSKGEVVGGNYATNYTPTNTDADRILTIGNGKLDASFNIQRSDAIIIHKNGLGLLPSVTNSLIDTNPKSIITKEYLDSKVTSSSGPSYKVLVAKVNQSGTNAPVLTIAENTTGYTITATRVSAGLYQFTWGVFLDENKIYGFSQDAHYYNTNPAGTYVIGLSTYGGGFNISNVWDNNISATMTDGLYNQPIEIRIYN